MKMRQGRAAAIRVEAIRWWAWVILGPPVRLAPPQPPVRTPAAVVLAAVVLAAVVLAVAVLAAAVLAAVVLAAVVLAVAVLAEVVLAEVVLAEVVPRRKSAITASATVAIA
jgi:hypothetical protein